MAEQVLHFSLLLSLFFDTFASKIAIQNEIEALQRHQQALYQQQLASNQVLSFQTTGLAPPSRSGGPHRRVHSTVPLSTPFTQSLSPQPNLMGPLGLGNLSLNGQTHDIPAGMGGGIALMS